MYRAEISHLRKLGINSFTHSLYMYVSCFTVEAGEDRVCTISVLGGGPAEARVQGPGQVGQAAPGAAVTFQNLH